MSSSEEKVDNLDKGAEEEIKNLAELFQKYKIDQYFWRRYKDSSRVRDLVLIFVVGILAVLTAILFCYFFLP